MRLFLRVFKNSTTRDRNKIIYDLVIRYKSKNCSSWLIYHLSFYFGVSTLSLASQKLNQIELKPWGDKFNHNDHTLTINYKFWFGRNTLIYGRSFWQLWYISLSNYYNITWSLHFVSEIQSYVTWVRVCWTFVRSSDDHLIF